MSRLRHSLAKHRADESGQTLVEYGLILGLITVVAIVGLTVMSGSVGEDGLYGVVSGVSEAIQKVLDG